MGRKPLVPRGDISRLRPRAPELPRPQPRNSASAPNSVFSAKTIAAVERMAKADRRQATTIEQWDADDFTFNMRED